MIPDILSVLILRASSKSRKINLLRSVTDTNGSPLEELSRWTRAEHGHGAPVKWGLEAPQCVEAELGFSDGEGVRNGEEAESRQSW